MCSQKKIIKNTIVKPIHYFLHSEFKITTRLALTFFFKKRSSERGGEIL